MTIQHTHTEKKGHFFVGAEDSPLADMTYTLPFPNKMIIDHTEVGDELRGKNVGYQLVLAAVEYARAHEMKILPLCPFANAMFKKKPELQDVLS